MLINKYNSLIQYIDATSPPFHENPNLCGDILILDG